MDQRQYTKASHGWMTTGLLIPPIGRYGAIQTRQQESLLYRTDWAVVRKAEKTTAIPSNISTWRDAIRTKATAMEDLIDGAADTAAVQVLIDNGSLSDWPVLGA